MGWQTRPNGRRYLYRSRRENGKPVKDYLGEDDDFGAKIAEELELIKRLESEARIQKRRTNREFKERIDTILATVAEQNQMLRIVTDAILMALGYHKHDRGEWRMKHNSTIFDQIGEQYGNATGQQTPQPMLRFMPPDNDKDAIKLFAKARAGDAEALHQVQALILERKWESWLGDIGRQAMLQLIARVATGDPIWKSGLTEHVKEVVAELLGDKPSALEKLLVQRVINGWIAVHAVELELAVRRPRDLKNQEQLDRAITRAQKRYTEAIRELTRIRRLEAPKILAQFTSASPHTVANDGASRTES